MKKTLIGFGVLALMFGGVATASATAVSSQFTSGGWIQFADDDGIVGPGGGGQAFDAEYLYYKLDGTKLSIGLQTGFDVEDGVQNYNGGTKLYYAGDLALSFDGVGNGYEYAFDFGFATKDYNDGEVGGQSDDVGLYQVSTWNLDNSIYFTDSNPFAMDSGSLVTDADGFNNSSTAAAWDSTVESYWRTVTFDMADLGFTFTDFDAHWTMSCGNDTIEGTAPVPEPATMLLFGTGLVGLVGLRRRKKK